MSFDLGSRETLGRIEWRRNAQGFTCASIDSVVAVAELVPVALEEPASKKHFGGPMAHPRMYDDSNPAIRRLRKVCSALDHVVEKEAWGECTFRVDGGAMFAMTNNHPDSGGVVEVWIKAPPMVQEVLVGSAPEMFFKPPYVGHKGWIGVRLDRKVDWAQVAELLRDGYEMSAPKRPRRTAVTTRPADPRDRRRRPRAPAGTAALSTRRR